jgi:DNA-binding transcriptional ArsR family regulator
VRGGRCRDGDLLGADEPPELIVPGTGTTPLPREALELLAQRFRALGDATRLALLQALFERERTVQELTVLARTSQANASKHLAMLLEQGLVARRRDGLFTRYRIADATLEDLCRLVCDSLAERHEAVRASLRGKRGPRDGWPPHPPRSEAPRVPRCAPRHTAGS